MELYKVSSLVGESWSEYLFDYFQSESFKILNNKIVEQRKTFIICPKKEDTFRVFKEIPINQIKVLILGQDPYHTVTNGEPIAIGRAFAVKQGVQVPPSLKNIIKELTDDLNGGVPIDNFDTTLNHWSDQGVFLLNTSLTSLQSIPAAHNKYWDDFTKLVLNVINTRVDNLVIILWGNYAKSYKKYLNNSTYKIIESAHPSPLSARNFFGSKPFSKCNNQLKFKNIGSINWTGFMYWESKKAIEENFGKNLYEFLDQFKPIND